MTHADADQPRRPGLAERKRRLVHEELVDVAASLMAECSFEETTVEQIAAAAGVSRRTFFRYFASKEDVLVQSIAHIGAKLDAHLAARSPAEKPSVALRRAFDVFVRHPTDPKDVRLATVIVRTPALMGRYLEWQIQWRHQVAAVIAGRAGVDPAVDPRPLLMVSVAFAAFDSAMNRWVAGQGAVPLEALLDEAFTLVAPAMDLI